MKRDQIESLKQNAKLDVRLPDQLKDEFLTRCREQGVSSGAVIRSMIIDYVTAQPRRLSVMAAGLKETVMKRPTWMTKLGGACAAAALGTLSLLLAPTASAEMQIAYRAAVDDGGGLIVSHGVALLRSGSGAGEPVADNLGETVRYALQARACEAPACPPGGAHVVLTLWDDSAGETVTDRGIVVQEHGETVFETTLNDGRLFTVILAPQTRT